MQSRPCVFLKWLEVGVKEGWGSAKTSPKGAPEGSQRDSLTPQPPGQATAEARACGFHVRLERSCGSPVKERCHRGGGGGQSQ